MEQKFLLINQESYHLVSNFSGINNTGGGVCIYARSDMIKNTVAKISLSFVNRKSLKHVQLKLSITIVLWLNGNADFNEVIDSFVIFQRLFSCMYYLESKSRGISYMKYVNGR
jgi:hypothetical protein